MAIKHSKARATCLTTARLAILVGKGSQAKLAALYGAEIEDWRMTQSAQEWLKRQPTPYWCPLCRRAVTKWHEHHGPSKEGTWRHSSADLIK